MTKRFWLMLVLSTALAMAAADKLALSDLELERQRRLIAEYQLLNNMLQQKQAEIESHAAQILAARDEPQGTIDWNKRVVLPKPKPEPEKKDAKK